MSAQPELLEPTPEREGRTGSRLRLLVAPRPVLSPLGFGLVIAALVVVGLGLVMVVSTTVAAQSRELASLRKEATSLEYTAAALTTQLQARSSTSALALRASDLGMVPNPYPAFIRLSDGTIIGNPTPVTGRETTYLRGATQVPVPSPLVASEQQPDMAAEQPVGQQVTGEATADAAGRATTGAGALPGLPTIAPPQSQEPAQ